MLMRYVKWYTMYMPIRRHKELHQIQEEVRSYCSTFTRQEAKETNVEEDKKGKASESVESITRR